MVAWNRQQEPEDLEGESQKQFHLGQMLSGQALVIDPRIFATLMAVASREAEFAIHLKQIGEKVKVMDEDHPDREAMHDVMACAYVGLMMSCMITGIEPTKPKE